MKTADLVQEFEDFWAVYPRHVAKITAKKAYGKARMVASAAQILDGVARYKQIKPGYADWMHPATWLNQERWTDEPDVLSADTREISSQERERALAHRRSIGRCPHDPRCGDTATCVGEIVRGWRRAERGE
jgi:hypothetical protein